MKNLSIRAVPRVMHPGKHVSQLMRHPKRVIHRRGKCRSGNYQSQFACLLIGGRPDFQWQCQRSHVVSPHAKPYVLRAGAIIPHTKGNQDREALQRLLALARSPFKTEDVKVFIG